MKTLGAFFADGVLPCLETLSLHGRDITDIGVAHLTEGFRQAPVHYLPLDDQRLTLHHTCMSDAGVVALAHTIQDGELSKLTSLDLAGNEMKGKGACFLAAAVLKFCPEIDCLDFSDKFEQKYISKIREMFFWAKDEDFDLDFTFL